MSTPKVSVVIPAYKAELFLAETLESIQAQTFTDWECLVVNDGSPDRTGELAETFARQDPRIRVLHQENGGVSRARNAGIAATQGQYIALMDADDIMYPTNLELKADWLDRHPETDYVFSYWEIGDQNLQNRREGPRGVDQQVLRETLRWERDTIPMLPSNLVYRRTCHERAPTLAFDPELSTAADQDYKVQLAQHFQGKVLPHILVVYRDRAGSMSTNIRLMEQDHLRVYRKAERNGCFPNREERNRAFGNLYFILAGSWWRNSNNKLRGLRMLLKALWLRPALLKQLLGKLAG